MSPSTELQAVYVLNRRTFQESSLIVDVFSLNFGRLSLLAKGALTSKKNNAALLQVFQPLLVGWTGRSDLKILTGIESPSPAIKLVSTRLYCAYYLNELILKLLPEAEQNSEVFSLYSESLERLAGSEKLEPILRRFELVLLSNLGYAPDFSLDNTGEFISPDCRYQYIHGAGFVKYVDSNNPNDGYLGHELIRIIEHDFLDPDTLLCDSSLDFLKTSKRLMRLLIDKALNGKTLNSRQLFMQINEKG